MGRVYSLLWKVLVCVFFAGGITLAQVTTGTILGTVSDSTGAVIPGASVAVRNVETGIARTVTSDAAGRYRASQLGLGNYEVTVETAGFQTVVRSGITLTVGREATVDFTLQVGAVTERITVTGEAPMVETTGSTVSSVVEGTAVRELPLNGRSFDQLAILQPGVYLMRSGTFRPSYGGGGSWISAGGMRQVQNATLLDGTQINGLFNRAGAGVGGRQLGVDAIREFRVLTSNYSAEYGRAVGAVINVVTRGGTNELHGSVFEFLRNSALDAKNFFDKPNDPIPPFKRNQFGLVLGGPIKQDRTFFFGVYEGVRDRLGLTQIAVVPTAAARDGILPTGSVNVNPAIKPFLAIYPLPNGRIRGDGTGENTASANQPNDENFWQIRLDHQLNSNHSIFGRYTFDRSTVTFPAVNLFVGYPPNTSAESENHYLTLQYTSILSPTVLNTARFGFVRSGHGQDRAQKPDILRLGRPPKDGVGRVRVTGLVNLGAFGTNTRTMRNLFEYSDDVTMTRGSHTLKFGGVIDRFRDFMFSDTIIQTDFLFAGLRNFLLGTTSSFRGVLPGDDSVIHWRQLLFGLFAQDDYRVSSRLTLNLGLRYEPITRPINVNSAFGGKVGVWIDPLRDKETSLVKHPFGENPSLKNFAPRVGFAWDPLGNGKTALRGGLSIAYEPILAYYYVFAHWQPPHQKSFRIASPVFPNQWELSSSLQVPPKLGAQEALPYDIPSNPKVFQYNLALQQELPRNWAVQVGYVGSRGLNLAIPRDINTPYPTILPDGRFFIPPGSTNRNPAFGELSFRPFEGIQTYSAFQLGAQQRPSQGFLVGGNYTFSRNTDDFSTIHGAEAPSNAGEGIQNPDCRSCEHGLSQYDRRHVFNLTTSYELPFGRNLTGLPGTMMRGWELSVIATIESGLPFTAGVPFDRPGVLTIFPTLNIRPDLKPGMNNNPVKGVTAGCPGVAAGRKLGDPDIWFDPCAFELQPAGFFGNVGRNTIVGPGTANFDFSLIKNTRWAERYNMQFRAEFFNIFNHPNFNIPTRDVFPSSSGIASGSAGRITSTTTTSRQIQFALKLTF